MSSVAEKAAEYIRSYQGRPIRIMEVCGTHTHEIFRQGIRRMLPESVHLISGPGCPVCVTPIDYIDEALFLAKEKHVTICTFGDLVRVPGTEENLQDVRAEGAKVRMVYSPMDALAYAEKHPEEDVVFLSVGFETTTPPSAISVREADARGVRNYAVLTANKTMDQAYRALRDSADAFLYPGHVSTITGTGIYQELKSEGISGVVTGFTGAELLTAIAVSLKKMEDGKPFFVNCYPRVVTEEGSPSGRAIINSVMEPIDSEWRGIGVIPKSGLKLRDRYEAFDARKKYSIPNIQGHADPRCRCGEVLKGECTPNQCPVFGRACTPEHPVGACMVSNEGACAAWFRYGRDFR
ncbi:MAG: hydrogenase formation protein HypD [Eubacteriales bacterium]|nr:hydrogenase formation protein HypD [Eubacteriales bacterium]